MFPQFRISTNFSPHFIQVDKQIYLDLIYVCWADSKRKGLSCKYLHNVYVNESTVVALSESFEDKFMHLLYNHSLAHRQFMTLRGMTMVDIIEV